MLLVSINQKIYGKCHKLIMHIELKQILIEADSGSGIRKKFLLSKGENLHR